MYLNETKEILLKEVQEQKSLIETLKRQKNITVAKFDPKEQTFVSKGFQGPYHCLADGCGDVVEVNKMQQRELVSHWTSHHGDIKKMLYFDSSTDTVLNVKVILNNVGICAHQDCDAVLYASKRCDFSNTVRSHWKHHPEKPSNYNLVLALSKRHDI